MDYSRVIDFMLTSGKRIKNKWGNIEDIGVTKKGLTEEDLAIENEFAELIKTFGQDHHIFAEEQHDAFTQSENLWIVDPISGTAAFIKGNGHYSIVIAHVQHGETVFAAVYDPVVDEMFTAYKGKGAFLNGKKIQVSSLSGPESQVVFNLSLAWKDAERAKSVFNKIYDYGIYRNANSLAVNYCHVACGRYAGFVAFTKDIFAEVASSLILREAGGLFTNINGENSIKLYNRIFVGGNPAVHQDLLKRLQ